MLARAHRPGDHLVPDPQTPRSHLQEPRNQTMDHGGETATGGSGGGTSIQVTALDGIVNVNSLFTLAAFLGLAWRPSSDGPGLADGADHLGACAAGDRIESDLVSFHVLAFACFLFSSLVALCLKQIVRTFPHYRRASHSGATVSWTVRINRAALRVGILASAVGSVCGCGFLMMALVNVVQVKLGRLGCGAGGSAAWGAVIPLVTLVPAAMLIYIGIVFYAFTR